MVPSKLPAFPGCISDLPCLNCHQKEVVCLCSLAQDSGLASASSKPADSGFENSYLLFLIKAKQNKTK